LSVPVAIIVAVARNGVIGADNRLLWRLKTDLRRFKALTTGKPLIVGRKTFESIGRALPGRHMIVVSRDPHFAAEAVERAADLAEALALGQAAAARLGASEVMIGGGGEIYAQALPLADRVYLTRVEIEPEGDAFFRLDESIWRPGRREDHRQNIDDEADFSFIDYARR